MRDRKDKVECVSKQEANQFPFCPKNDAEWKRLCMSVLYRLGKAGSNIPVGDASYVLDAVKAEMQSPI